MWGKIVYKIKGWRIIALNAFATLTSTLSVVFAALVAARQEDPQDLDAVLGQFLTPTRAASALALLGLLNIMLRLITTGPVGSKQ